MVLLGIVCVSFMSLLVSNKSHRHERRVDVLELKIGTLEKDNNAPAPLALQPNSGSISADQTFPSFKYYQL